MDKFLFYDVTPGEDLETIASKLYGEKERSKAIYEMNKEKLPSSPGKSLAQMKILIPVYDINSGVYTLKDIFGPLTQRF